LTNRVWKRCGTNINFFGLVKGENHGQEKKGNYKKESQTSQKEVGSFF
jgi:hypothetical protein